MRLRLGLLRDTTATIEKAEVLERQRRAQETLKKMKNSEAIDPGATAQVRPDHSKSPGKDFGKRSTTTIAKAEPRIRPLSESKAVDAGANFISEAFLFVVAGGLILLESLRSRRKEANRRDAVREKLDLLETRTRQDAERLLELEGRDKRHDDRVFSLEEEVWKLRGGKGQRPEKGKERFREFKPTPLWEIDETDQNTLWQRIGKASVFRAGKEDGVEEGEIVAVQKKLNAAQKTTEQ